MIILLALLAQSEPSPHADIVQPLGSFGEINWTTMNVTASGEARQRTTEGIDGVEAAAERVASSALRLAIQDVPVQRGVTVEDLLDDRELGKQITTRMLKRTISKVTYGDRADVVLELSLPLSDLLKPWTWQRVDVASGDVDSIQSTGLVIDARGHRVAPAWAPRIIDSQGQEFYSGQLSAKSIRQVSPAVYVRSGAVSAAQRAGGAPLFVGVAKVKGSEFYLTDADSQRLHADPFLYDRMLEGRLVIVMDP